MLLDMAGMVVCLYRRGVPFVRVPTTLLALVDASVGVKMEWIIVVVLQMKLTKIALDHFMLHPRAYLILPLLLHKIRETLQMVLVKS